jgi:hypothetical protein
MIANYLLLLPIGYMLLTCVIRLNVMTPSTTHLAWRVAYVAIAAWTGAVAADLATTGAVPLRDALGVLATALYVHLTRHCAPAAAQRNSGV